MKQFPKISDINNHAIIKGSIMDILDDLCDHVNSDYCNKIGCDNCRFYDIVSLVGKEDGSTRKIQK